MVLEVEGEIIKNLSPEIGFLHRGTEKLCESKEYPKLLPYFDRFDYVSTIAGEQAYSLATEKLMNLNITRYASAARVVFVELIRITNHLLALTCHAMDVGAITPFLWAFEEREEICNILEVMTGARVHCALIRPGGLNSIITPEVALKTIEFINNIRPKIKETYSLFGENPIWINRLKGVGVITKKLIYNYGIGGVLARGSGFSRDLRRTSPYDNYQVFYFNTPTLSDGDCWARFILRVAEMYESTLIIEQGLEVLLSYHLSTSSQHLIKPLTSCFRFNPPEKNKALSSMEEHIHDFIMYSEGFSIFKNRVYQAIESPKGEFGVTIISQNLDPTKPLRLKVKGPGFNHLQSFNGIAAGHLLTDTLTILGSLDIVLGEIDR